MPRTRAERPTGLTTRSKNTKGGDNGAPVKPTRAGKRQAEDNPNFDGKSRKRAAFGDITNAVNERQNSITKQVKKGLSNIVNRGRKSTEKPAASASAVAAKKFQLAAASTSKQTKTRSKQQQGSSIESLPSSQESEELKKAVLESPDADDEESSYDSVEGEESLQEEASVPRYQPPARPIPPPGVIDFDKENWDDPNQVSEYAMDTFYYYRHREKEFAVRDYMPDQPEISKPMRAILVDWLVEVQESFELNHEALYTAVKIMDLYMSKNTVPKEQLQLIGATACLIACKIDERLPPMLDDFVYVCDDAYNRHQIMDMERKVIASVGFDVGFPLSYRFVRRYARVLKVELPVLTLARYILETSLMEYRFNVNTSESQLATAAIILAMKMKGITGWKNTLAFYSGYTPMDVADLVHDLHAMLKSYPKEALKTVRQKYSHRVFHEVATIPVPETIELTESG